MRVILKVPEGAFMDYLKEDIMEGQYISGGYWKVTLNGKV